MSTLTEPQLRAWEEACGESGVEFRDDYSGRGMYGRTTVGAVGTMPQIFLFLQVLGQLLDAYGGHLIRNIRLDDMGLQAIVYVH